MGQESQTFKAVVSVEIRLDLTGNDEYRPCKVGGNRRTTLKIDDVPVPRKKGLEGDVLANEIS
jgi:hypothetical protein